MLEERLTAVDGLATSLRLPPVSTVQDVDVLLGLADAAFVPHRPERTWLSADGLAQARAAAHTLRTRVTDLDGTESSARRLYTDAALTQPLADLHERFTSVHKGFRKLLGAYRRDKKIVAAFTTRNGQTLEALSATWAWPLPGLKRPRRTPATKRRSAGRSGPTGGVVTPTLLRWIRPLPLLMTWCAAPQPPVAGHRRPCDRALLSPL